jgi:hypothetical protein
MQKEIVSEKQWWFVRSGLKSALVLSALALITLLSWPGLVDKIAGHLSAMIPNTSEFSATASR